MKKIISLFLSTVMLTSIATITANSASVGKNNTGAHNYTVLGKTTINDAQVRFYKYNFTNSNPRTGIKMDDISMKISKEFYFNDITDDYKQINVSGGSVFEHWLILESGKAGTQSRRYDTTGGTYEKIRIKLSDYSDYFNSNGTHTKDGHDYNFTVQKSGDTDYASSLVFWSGGIFTAVTPDKNGYVEMYVCKDIEEDVRFFTNFCFDTPTTNGSGGGTNGGYLIGFTMGDTNFDGYVSVSDATKVQSYIAGKEEFDNLQKRNADVTGDGKININDATMIQKYLADKL